jgi:spermidine synthase
MQGIRSIMNPPRFLYLSVFLLSVSVLCSEIIATRITSVVFVYDYAFFIVSLAILGLGSGGVYSYYRINEHDISKSFRIISKFIVLFSLSLCVFIISVIVLSITNPFIYFLLLSIPFFSAGIVYSQIFKHFANTSYKLYAADLAGGAIGSVLSLGSFSVFGAPNSIFILAVMNFGLAVSFMADRIKYKVKIVLFSVLILSFSFLVYNGKKEILGSVPIGYFSEKDFFFVYPDISTQAQIIDSRWSIHGRSDLVRYSHQDMVQQLFIDGSAGTQVYRFNGNIQKTNSMLQEVLLHNSIAIPFLFLKEDEKNNMLIIGPGGGKEVLIGLFSSVKKITGVEINSDFVDIVKDHKNFNGGIYTDFSNVHILVKEGRHYIKQSKDKFDLIVMALPSTAQMQSIEPFAMSENYLLTKEAIEDYLNTLTPKGRLIFTVHNRWELMRLITTTMSAFNKLGIENSEVINHFAVLDADYAPTLVIKRTAFTKEEVLYWRATEKIIPKYFPEVTYLPLSPEDISKSRINSILESVSQDKEYLQRYIEQSNYDISPCSDDNPYFYKIHKSVPGEFLWMLAGIIGFNAIVIWLPVRLLRRKKTQDDFQSVLLPLVIIACIGAGFMILEISLFQKLILYLGSPTVSLSILLSTLLIGMGVGSLGGNYIFRDNVRKRLFIAGMFIVVYGVLLFIVSPLILSKCLVYTMIVRSLVSFVLVLPFGSFLGIPFPSCIQLLKQRKLEKYIPWMYGVNGAMAVLGSMLAIILSMLFGFTPTFFIGLAFYFVILVLLWYVSQKRYIVIGKDNEKRT